MCVAWRTCNLKQRPAITKHSRRMLQRVRALYWALHVGWHAYAQEDVQRLCNWVLCDPHPRRSARWPLIYPSLRKTKGLMPCTDSKPNGRTPNKAPRNLGIVRPRGTPLAPEISQTNFHYRCEDGKLGYGREGRHQENMAGATTKRLIFVS